MENEDDAAAEGYCERIVKRHQGESYQSFR